MKPNHQHSGSPQSKENCGSSQRHSCSILFPSGKPVPQRIMCLPLYADLPMRDLINGPRTSNNRRKEGGRREGCVTYLLTCLVLNNSRRHCCTWSFQAVQTTSGETFTNIVHVHKLLKNNHKQHSQASTYCPCMCLVGKDRVLEP